MSVWGTVYIIISLEAFPGSRASTTSPPWWLVSCLSLKNPDLPKFSAYALSLGQPTPSLFSLLRPSITDYISTGILTRFPSTTHFCLALGADSPCADVRGAGTLGLSASGSLTRFIVTHVSIRTSDISRSPHGSPFADLQNAPLPRIIRCTRSFGVWLEPRYIFGAEPLI